MSDGSLDDLLLETLETTNVIVQCAWLNLITDEVYNRHRAAVVAAAEVIAGFGGVGLNSSFEAFDALRKSYLASRSYNYTVQESASQILASLTRERIREWSQRMNEKRRESSPDVE